MAEDIKLELFKEVPAPELENQVIEKPEEAPVIEIPEDAGYMENVNLSEEEKQMVTDFAKTIDISDTQVVMCYGASAQKKIADFSDTALEGVKTKNLGEIGDKITDLVTQLKGFKIDEEEPRGLAKLFKKSSNKLTSLKARYETVDKNVDNIVGVLEGHQNQLTTDVVMLDKMYENNLTYFKELTMYILAGKEKLEEEKNTTLVEMKKKAEETGLAEDAQAANDYAGLIDRFEKKIYDLELTRTISLQMAPQIRLIQNSDSLMNEKIQSIVNNTIPLWKNQMVLALSMEHSQEAMKAQKAVTDMTNELIEKNAEALKTGSVKIAEESEKGIVAIESVEKANENLIITLNEVVRIQEEGREKRKEAENQLGIMEAQLKNKLLDIKTKSIRTEEPEGEIVAEQ